MGVGAGLAVLLLLAVPATAQTPPQASGTAPVPVSAWYLGGLSGAGQVERTGPVAGVEFGVRLRQHVQVVVESGWMADIVTRSRIDEVAAFADYVARTQGLPTTSTIEGPALFAMAGLRLIPDRSPEGVRPYVMVSTGLARVEYKPVFTVDGNRVTGGISLYGVTLGRDLLGTTNRFAYSAGAGIVFGDTWYLDMGLRLTRIHTTDHPTTVKRVVIAMGRRF